MSSSSPNNKILLTGGFGLLGSRLRLLLEQIPEAEIIAITRRADQLSKDSKVTTILGDLRDKSLWEQLPNDITHVFHLAATVPWTPEDRQKLTLVFDNVMPVVHLIEHSQHWSNLQQVIFSSSVSVYSRSTELLKEDAPRQAGSLYGAAKAACEKRLLELDERNIRTVLLRFASLYGNGQNQNSVLPIMVRRASAKQPILVFGDGSRTQDFLHCEDAARALLMCFQNEVHGTYNVGSGNPTSMLELAQTVSRVSGEVPIELQPDKADNDPGIKLDVTKIKREVGFESQISLEHGLQQLKREMSIGAATE